MQSYASRPKKIARTIESVRPHASMPSITELLQCQRPDIPLIGKSDRDRPLQRVVISTDDVPGLQMDLNTDRIELAQKLIYHLCMRMGKRASLQILQDLLLQERENGREIPEILFKYIQQILATPASKDSDSKKDGYFVKRQFIKSHPPMTEEERDPAIKQGLRIWVVGDPGRGITWKTIGLYLQGRLSAEDVRTIGMLTLLREDAEQVEQADDDTLTARGRGTLDAAAAQLNGSLDALPAYNGVSYRQAGIASAQVYGGLIHVGDHIQDASFWSTSALKIDGSAGEWGAEGTEDAPRVYYIIDGHTGRYISQYAGIEEGQHEVLFKNGMVFAVMQIANYQNRTFFVHLYEVNPADLPAGTILKNPYTGAPVE